MEAEMPPWLLEVGPAHLPSSSRPPWLKKHLYCWVPRLYTLERIIDMDTVDAGDERYVHGRHGRNVETKQGTTDDRNGRDDVDVAEGVAHLEADPDWTGLDWSWNWNWDRGKEAKAGDGVK